MQTLKVVLTVFALSALPASTAEARCRYVTEPTSVIFGNYTVFGTGNVDVFSSFAIRCNPNSTGSIMISQSPTSGSSNPRQMASGAERLNFYIYQDAAGTQIFGSSGDRMIVVNATAQDKDFQIDMYFRLPLGADVGTGLYGDTFTVTIDPLQGGGSPSRTLPVSATVLPECVADAFALNFGTYDPLGLHGASPLDGQTVLNVRCTKGTTASVSLGGGNNPAPPARRMTSGGNLLTYNIFIDAGRATIWNSVNTRQATSTSKNIPLANGLIGYGRIPAGQDAFVGSYTDTVVATVNY